MTRPEPTPHAAARLARDARQNTFATSLVTLIVLAAALLLAPVVASTVFWVEHFPAHGLLQPLLIAGPLLLAAALAPALRPLTWDAELLARGLRGLAWAYLLFHALAILLEAPRLAAIAALPPLAALPLATLQSARRATPLGAGATLRLLVAAVITALAALALAALAWMALPSVWIAILAAPIAAIYVAAPWFAATATRREHPLPAPGMSESITTTHPLDLPPGTLHPPAGLFPLTVTLTGLLFLLVIVAPGVPLTAPVAWLALIIALPLVTAAILRRGGIAHERGLAGPATMRRHEAHLEILSDAQLEEIDEAVARFLRWGSGRSTLALRLARLLSAADPDATPEALSARLARLPRRPWARRRRAEGLVQLLRDDGLLRREGPP